MPTDAILRLWGKTKKGITEPSEFHPALFHVLNVALDAHLGRGCGSVGAGGDAEHVQARNVEIGAVISGDGNEKTIYCTPSQER